MSILGYIVIFTFLGSIVSLIGGIALLANQKLALKISHFLSSFAAGALLATAFFDLLPEAEEAKGDVNIFLWVLIAILGFFLLERFIHGFHHHDEHPTERRKPTALLIVLGDAVHNFIDGVAIAATFMVDIRLGIITSLAVGAHEIPQEIGDFGILLHQGIKRAKVLLLNVLSAVTALAGAILTFYLGDSIQGFLPIFLALTAGFFIYIAAADLIPEIHYEKRKGYAFLESVLLLLGVGTIWLFVTIFE